MVLYFLYFTFKVMVPGTQNDVLLKTLIPDTEYKVTVTPIYTTGEGVSVSAPGRTCKSIFASLGTSLPTTYDG